MAICGFMGWDDCFDFSRRIFTSQDTKAKEIWRVLKAGGKFISCSWDVQEDLSWMEEAVIRNYPAILKDPEYLENHPIGMAHENAEGYEIIFRRAGFKHIKIFKEAMTFVSSDEEEWWLQMQNLGWDSLLEKIKNRGDDQLSKLKEDIFTDLQSHKLEKAIHFEKSVFFVQGVK